jgi:hypothetical protein
MKTTNNKCYITDTNHNNTIRTYLLIGDEEYRSIDNKGNIILAPKIIFPKATNDRASHLNKYHHYYSAVNMEHPDWKLLKTLSDDYWKLRGLTILNKKINSTELSNLLSDKERLKQLHKYLTRSLNEPEYNIESGIDDIEISFRMQHYWQQDFINELKNCEEVKDKEYRQKKNYRIRYGRAKRFVFKTGGSFVFHYRPEGVTNHGECSISFRLSESPLENVQQFFTCLQKALGSNYSDFTDYATVTRQDPFFIIKGIPVCMLLVEEKDLTIDKSTYPTAYTGLLETLYIGNIVNSCQFAIYDMLVKYEDIKKGIPKSRRKKKSKRLFGKLFKKEQHKICMAKVERRIFSHRNGSKCNKINEMHLLKGNSFSRLKFYSPLVFGELPASINKKILIHGIATVRQHLTGKQLKTLETVLSNPLHHLSFDHEELIRVISAKLSQLEGVILDPPSRFKK